jgi:hypothetical protein
MMEWNVKPAADINNIAFGTDRETVRAELGAPVKEFKKSKYSKNTTDDYGKFHVFYDADNNLEAIEIFEGTVSVEGKKIFPGSLRNVMSLDDSFEQDEEGCTSSKLEIGVYAPGGNIESVLIGCEGYY